jgi:ATP-binding cassette subfamily B protein
LEATTDAWGTLPEARRGEVGAELAPGESVLAWLEPDLDVRLHYRAGLVVLTDRRVLADDQDDPGSADDNGAHPARRWRSWPLAEVAEVRTREHAGLGTLDLLGRDGRLAHWRYTIARAPGAHRLAQRFEAFRRDGRIDPDDLPDPTCPRCGEPLPPDQGTCPACTPATNVPAASSLSRLLRFAKPHAGAILLGFVLTVASTAASMIWPYLTIPLVDDILVPYQAGKAVDFGTVPWFLLGMAGSAVLAWLLTWWRTYVLSWASERVAVDIRMQTYEHLQRLSLEFFGGKRTGDLMSRLSTDTDRICNYLSINLLDFATDVLMIAMTTIILVSIDVGLAFWTLVPFPIIVWLVYWVRNHLKHGFQRGNRAWAEMTSVLADAIPGIRVVKAFAQERREIARFGEANARVLRANDRVNRTWSFFGPFVTFLTQVGLLVVWAFGVWRIYRDPAGHEFRVGVLTGFLTYITRFYARMESMSRMVQMTQRTVASANRIFEILDRTPSVPEPARPVHPGRLEGRIELRDVGFRYGNRVVLHGVNLAIEPGEMIGLVGPSGAGKSTLVNLVCRFYDVSEGAILVDGVDIRQLSVREYRRHIGIVLQEPFLFYGTVAENIAYGRPDATREEIIAAARAARAHEFILRLPDGYDSFVGERGQSLSGGERQRISIARAILIDPKILILDEATSSVDTETEREIQEALDNLIQGRTTIAIAHRLSTLSRADRLVVLERGRIAEVGHHHELLKSPAGAYSRLHKAQAELARAVH